MRRRLALLVPVALVLAGISLGVARISSDGSAGSSGKQRLASARPPVVMLVFDEFPLDTLLRPNGRIDAARYPNFAALARGSTWFPNATTVYDSTPKALPAIMDARLPRPGPPATAKGHPNSVFTLFGRRGYRIVASEESTAVCPRRFCRRATGRKPSVLRNLAGGRPQRLERWIRSIRPARRPAFYFKDVLLPHGPWLYLPSGKQMRPTRRDPIPRMAGVAGFADAWLTRHNLERYLLQLEFVDRELGKLLARLRETGLFDQAMIVVTADHGLAWEVGVRDRRKVTRRNVDEIAPIPLFVKAPGQRRGRIDRSHARTIDIVPTMAALLGVRLPWRADGRSAFSAATRRRRIVRLPTRDFSHVVRIPATSIALRRRANVRRRAALFGVGTASLYRFGPRRELVGRQLSELRVRRSGRARAKVRYAAALQQVDHASHWVPTQIAGRIRRGRAGDRRDVAVALNGRVEAVGRSFYLRGSRKESFSLVVPEGSLRQGRNAVRVFQVRGRGRSQILVPVGGA